MSQKLATGAIDTDPKPSESWTLKDPPAYCDADSYPFPAHTWFSIKMSTEASPTIEWLLACRIR